MNFAERLKYLRKKHKFTQKYVAKMLNCDKSTISKYESGKINPSLKNAIKICQIFGVKLDYLAGLVD